MSLLQVGGELMCGIKIPQYEFVLKMQGELMPREGAYLRDTTVFQFMHTSNDITVKDAANY